MIVVEKYKLLFISNPKTGTTSVQRQLLVLDEDLKLNYLPKSLIDKGINPKLNEHDKAIVVKERLKEHYSEYNSFVFVRSIFEKAVSAYFFYKNGAPITRSDNKRQLIVRINKILTYVLPFSIWSLLKPIKTNYDYILDQKGFIIVKFIGKTESLQEDLESLLMHLSVPVNPQTAKVNSSSHGSTELYFKGRLHRALFKMKYRKEINLLDSLKKYSITDDLQGKHVKEL